MGGSNKPDSATRQRLLSELFHALSQPLTTLRCSLELAVLCPRTEQQYRETVKAALEQAELVSQLFTTIREILEGEISGEGGHAHSPDICEG